MRVPNWTKLLRIQYLHIRIDLMPKVPCVIYLFLTVTRKFIPNPSNCFPKCNSWNTRDTWKCCIYFTGILIKYAMTVVIDPFNTSSQSGSVNCLPNIHAQLYRWYLKFENGAFLRLVTKFKCSAITISRLVRFLSPYNISLYIMFIPSFL